jgi:hypothetical protein
VNHPQKVPTPSQHYKLPNSRPTSNRQDAVNRPSPKQKAFSRYLSLDYLIQEEIKHTTSSTTKIYSGAFPNPPHLSTTSSPKSYSHLPSPTPRETPCRSLRSSKHRPAPVRTFRFVPAPSNALGNYSNRKLKHGAFRAAATKRNGGKHNLRTFLELRGRVVVVGDKSTEEVVWRGEWD